MAVVMPVEYRAHNLHKPDASFYLAQKNWNLARLRAIDAERQHYRELLAKKGLSPGQLCEVIIAGTEQYVGEFRITVDVIGEVPYVRMPLFVQDEVFKCVKLFDFGSVPDLTWEKAGISDVFPYSQLN